MHNVGKTDRIIRIVLGLILIGLTQFDVIKGDWASGLAFVAIVLIMTGIRRCSPIYSLLGFGTCGIPKDDSESKIKTKKIKL